MLSPERNLLINRRNLLRVAGAGAVATLVGSACGEESKQNSTVTSPIKTEPGQPTAPTAFPTSEFTVSPTNQPMYEFPTPEPFSLEKAVYPWTPEVDFAMNVGEIVLNTSEDWKTYFEPVNLDIVKNILTEIVDKGYNPTISVFSTYSNSLKSDFPYLFPKDPRASTGNIMGNFYFQQVDDEPGDFIDHQVIFDLPTNAPYSSLYVPSSGKYTFEILTRAGTSQGIKASKSEGDLDFSIFVPPNSNVATGLEGNQANLIIGNPLFQVSSDYVPVNLAEATKNETGSASFMIDVVNPKSRGYKGVQYKDSGFRFLTYNGKIAFIPEAP